MNRSFTRKQQPNEIVQRTYVIVFDLIVEDILSNSKHRTLAVCMCITHGYSRSMHTQKMMKTKRNGKKAREKRIIEKLIHIENHTMKLNNKKNGTEQKFIHKRVIV